MYFATFSAPGIGLDEALNSILTEFGVAHTVTSRIQFFDFKKIVIGIFAYCFFAWLYIVYVPYLGPTVAYYLGPDHAWPDPDNNALTLEMLILSLQVALTLICGLSFFDLSGAHQSDAYARKTLILRIASAQIIFGLVIGLAFHVMTVWRTKSGDNSSVRPYDYLDIALVVQATFPSLIAPLLLWIWSLLRRSGFSTLLASFGMSLIGGAFLSLNQRTYDLTHKSSLHPAGFYVHEWLIGFSIVAACLLIRTALRDGDISLSRVLPGRGALGRA
jgi:hypothetical protein